MQLYTSVHYYYAHCVVAASTLVCVCSTASAVECTLEPQSRTPLMHSSIMLYHCNAATIAVLHRINKPGVLSSKG
jgi:hypothetical protein